MRDNSPVIHDAIETLREDAALLELALMGAEVAIIPFIFSCLLRLTESLKQHIEDMAALYSAP